MAAHLSDAALNYDLDNENLSKSNSIAPDSKTLNYEKAWNDDVNSILVKTHANQRPIDEKCMS